MELSNKKIELICKKSFKDCSLDSFREIEEAGRVNHIFEININNPKKVLILKIYPKRWEHYKPDKEKFVFDLIMSKTGLPVPKIHILDKSKKIVSNTYILMDKAEGTMLKFAKIPKKEKSKLFYELGKDLAKLHSIKFNKFGWIYKDKISKYETKYSEPDDSMKNYFKSAYEEIKEELRSAEDKKYKNLNKKSFLDLIPEIDKFVEGHIHVLDNSIKPAFIHNDFTMENILVKKNKHWKISCILDVEMSKSADPDFELERYTNRFIFNGEEYSKAFMKGYTSIIKLSDNFDKKKSLYRIVRLLSWASFDGFVIGRSNYSEMEHFYKRIKELLYN